MVSKMSQGSQYTTVSVVDENTLVLRVVVCVALTTLVCVVFCIACGVSCHRVRALRASDATASRTIKQTI